ncbi:MAG: hemolysin family protein [Bacilli bacterium]|nr:hemolysin family protein [Bacilli bacterium]
MSFASIAYIIVITILIVFSGIFSASDMAYSVAPLRQLKKASETSKGARLAYGNAKNYDKTITVLLFSNSLVNVIASSLGALLAIQIVRDIGITDTQEITAMEGTLSTIISMAMLLIILTFGEIMPKAFAKVHSYGVCVFSAPIIKVLSVLLFPFVRPSELFGTLVTSPFVKKFEEVEDAPVKDEELSEMFEAIEDEGIIDEENADLLQSALEFKDTTAFEIMTPRMKIEGISLDEDIMKIVKSGKKFNHSRIPVYQGSLDNIVGYIQTKSLYKSLLLEKKVSITSLLLPIIAVPMTMEISSILELMQEKHRHIAVVKDEFGGTDGILTLEDILEELVGELWDENDTVKIDIQRLNKRNQYRVLGSTDIETFFETFHMDEEEIEDDYETLSGFINDYLGRFAVVGDKVNLPRVEIIVTKASPYTVEEAKVIYHPRRKKVS